MKSLTIEDLEARLDAIVAEALRRQRRMLNVKRAGKDEAAATMAKVRRELKAWRDRATGDALRSAVSR